MSEQKQQNIIEQVETFIQHLRNLDFIVSPEGNKIRYRQGVITTLSDELADSISIYEASKYDPKECLISAHKCMRWINRACASDIIKEGDGLINKFKECFDKNIEISKKNIELAKDLDETNRELWYAKEKIKELEQMIPHYIGVVE